MVHSIVQGHTTSKWKSKDLNPGLDSVTALLITGISLRITWYLRQWKSKKNRRYLTKKNRAQVGAKRNLIYQRMAPSYTVPFLDAWNRQQNSGTGEIREDQPFVSQVTAQGTEHEGDALPFTPMPCARLPTPSKALCTGQSQSAHLGAAA